MNRWMNDFDVLEAVTLLMEKGVTPEEYADAYEEQESFEPSVIGSKA